MEEEIVEEQEGDPPEISFIRLVTGEDIIAEHVAMDEDNLEYFLFFNPMRVVYYAYENNPMKVHVNLTEWVFSSLVDRQEFMVAAKDVITMGLPSKNILEYYNRMVAKKDSEPTKSEEAQAQASPVSDLEYLKDALEGLSGKGNPKKFLN
jgi:hypothetical protein